MKLDERDIEDLLHQLRGPLSVALARLNRILGETPVDERLRRDLSIVRGLCRKASQVSRNADLFTALRGPESVIPLKLTKLRRDELVKMLIESAMDNEVLVSPEKGISIWVDVNSFQVVDELSADPALIQQAINNLLDNAVKYSFASTVIRVHARREQGTLSVVVENKGIPIRPNDVPNLTKRGWRSSQASFTTGEGSGIGLWVADNIMKAHQGSVVITPTDADNRTLVQLNFPADE
jgi:signal transduction histidine kinase